MAGRFADTPWHLWLIGLLALIWNSFGAYDYVMTQTGNTAYLSQLTPDQLAYVNAFPVWAEAAWAVAVWSAVLGTVLLLLRSRWAAHLFALSLIGMAISFGYQVSSGGLDLMGTVGAIMTGAIVLIAVYLTWYTFQLKSDGVLR